MDQTGGANGSCMGEGSTEPTEISNGAHRGPSSTPRARDSDILRPPRQRPRGIAAAATAARPRSEPPTQPCGARPRGAPGPCRPPGPLRAGARCHRTGTGDAVAASRPVPRDRPLLPVPVQPPRRGPGGAGPALPSGSCRSGDPRGPPAAGTRGPGGGGRRGRGEGPRERSGHGAVLRGARHSPGRRGRAGPGRAGQPVPARRGRAKALRGRRSPRPVRAPGAARPRAGRGCQRRGGAGRCGAGLAGHRGGCGGLRACGPQCRGRGPVTNLRPPHRAVPLDVPHGAGEAPRPPPRSAARPAGYRAGGGSGPGGSPSGSAAGVGATRPPGLGRRVRVLSTGRPRCARGHPPSHGGARRWAPGGGYRAEGNGAGESGASGTGTEDSRAGDIETAGNGAACAALAVRCPSGSARCRAPGAARAWSERPPPLPPPPPSFSSPRCGASVAPRPRGRGSLSPSHSGCRCQCLLRRRRCRRTAARSARGPTRRLGQGPAPARRPPPPARLGKQVRTHRPAPPRAGPRPPLPGHPGPAPPRTHGTRGQAEGSGWPDPPSGRPDGISMETVPGHPRGRRWGGAGGGVRAGGTGDVLRRDSGGGAAGTDSAGRGAAGGAGGSAPRPATARRSRCPARHGCSGSGTGGTCRCRGARRSRGGGGTAAPGARGVWRRGPSPPRPPLCPGPVRPRVPAGRVPGGGGRALPGGSAAAATSMSGAAPVRQRGGPAAPAGAAGRSAGERPRGQLLSRGLRERARGSTAGPSPRHGCGVRGEAPGAAARPPCPGQGGLPAPRGPGGGAGPWAVPWPLGARSGTRRASGGGLAGEPARTRSRGGLRPGPGRCRSVPTPPDARGGAAGAAGPPPVPTVMAGQRQDRAREAALPAALTVEETSPPAVACRYREGSWLLGERHRSPHPSLGEAGSEQRREKVHQAEIETK
ncbi:collagen alpha-1(III) chain-like [Melozone crissalis]|uniref:collagen alpha-1(III) chain-like n=1 Tax=Melozone crissalis TaxID=40204 RepID=UPI0023DC91D8|nr:collagen alpha-1(III) chain-like [Melozone crissalis]